MVKKLLIVLLVIIGLGVTALYLSGNQHIIQAVKNTYLVGQSGPSIDDFNLFSHRRIASAEHTKTLPMHSEKKQLSKQALRWLDSTQTATFLVVYRDSILAEHYFQDYVPAFLPNTFSVAKSMVSMCIGVLLREGKINGLDEPASTYIAELAEKGYDKITIRHLLQMSSGMGFDEDYKNPFGYQAKVYYGDQLRANTLAFDAIDEPGEKWFYAGGNTVLLALIVEAASGQKLAHYFAEKIWQPIGAEADAWWTIEDNGLERSSCCFYAITRDLARLGMLYQNGGKWNGRDIVSEQFVQESITPVAIPDRYGETAFQYGYQWWLGQFNGHQFYQAQGMLGQYIIVVPELELVIVRTGHHRSMEKQNGLPTDCYQYIAIANNLLS